MKHISVSSLVALILFLTPQVAVFGQPTSGNFSYQGIVKQNGVPANGNYQMAFEVFTAPTGGTVVLSASFTSVTVTEGVFNVAIPASTTTFSPGANLWIETSLRPVGSAEPLTVLSPRQRVLQNPAAMSSLISADSQRLGGTEANQFVLTNDPRLSDSRPPSSGSANYIQNTSSLQPQNSSNFNISGTGRANLFQASDIDSNNGYRLSGQPFLNQVAGSLALGTSAGSPNVGVDNSMVGFGAGLTNTSNSQFNSFFGMNSGRNNTGGTWNTYLGWRSGWNINSGNFNTAVGASSGANIVSGSSNTIFGASAGGFVMNGSRNSFFGYLATGETSTNDSTAIGAFAYAPNSNTVVIGGVAGQNNATLTPNVGIGTTAPTARLHVVGNTLFDGALQFSGSLTGNGAGLTNLNAGALTTGTVPQARLGNSVIFNQTDQQATSNFNISGTGTAAVLNAAVQYNIAGTRILSTPGTNNTFAGAGTGNANTTGNANSFFGHFAGESNSSGFLNSFFGAFAGAVNTTGEGNSFFGASAGASNTGGLNNAFFGRNAGGLNTNGASNTIIGPDAGGNNVSGGNNTFVGRFAGGTNSTGSSNTMLGFAANSSSNNLSNATAIGANSFVSQSNSLVLGSINGLNGATSNTNVGIGTSAPAYPLDIQGRLRLRQPLPTSPGNTAGLFLSRNDANGSPIDTAFVGMRDNTSVGFYSGQLVAWPFYVETDTGLVVVSNLGPAGSTQLCRNANNQIASCSSSIQYKDNVVSMGSGLDLIRKLRPVSFNWRNGGSADIGLVAEEVAAVEPLLTTTNAKGEVEGVKYDRVGVVAVNAIKEQQQQIETQEQQIRAQQKRITELEAELTALKALVCAGNLGAPTCRSKK